MKSLALNSNYKKRLKVFRNQQILLPEYVEVAAIKLREHVIDSDTKLIQSTLHYLENGQFLFDNPAINHL